MKLSYIFAQFFTTLLDDSLPLLVLTITSFQIDAAISQVPLSASSQQTLLPPEQAFVAGLDEGEVQGDALSAQTGFCMQAVPSEAPRAAQMDSSFIEFLTWDVTEEIPKES